MQTSTGSTVQSSINFDRVYRALMTRTEGPVTPYVVACRAMEAIARGEDPEVVAEALAAGYADLKECGDEIPSNEFPECTREEVMGYYD